MQQARMLLSDHSSGYPGYKMQNCKLCQIKVPVHDIRVFLLIAIIGLCLSLHQPYASLLVKGVKMHEGRVWYTEHRGRLWIAAAAHVRLGTDDFLIHVTRHRKQQTKRLLPLKPTAKTKERRHSQLSIQRRACLVASTSLIVCPRTTTVIRSVSYT